VHEAALVLAVVAHRQAPAGAVVPHEQIAGAPMVPVLELRVDQVPVQLGNEW
jgi:hypothetical protein